MRFGTPTKHPNADVMQAFRCMTTNTQFRRCNVASLKMEAVFKSGRVCELTKDKNVDWEGSTKPGSKEQQRLKMTGQEGPPKEAVDYSQGTVSVLGQNTQDQANS